MGAHRPLAEGELHPPNSAVLETLKQPPPKVLLALLRLGLAARESTAHAPDFLLALLQGPGGEAWRTALTSSMKLLVVLAAPKLDSMADPACDPAGWEHLWLQYPGQWAALLKLARQSAPVRPG